MKVIERSALVNYSAEQMYALVYDFESYPKFMHGCTGAELLSRGEGWIEARLDLAKAGIKQSIITRNTLRPPESMQIALVKGPFSHFEGEWTFQPLADGACKVVYVMAFAFSNPILGFAAGKLFEQVASDQVKAICERAKSVYS